jgi:nicotinamide mononucleotide (NMN) deamidase PncC
MIERIHNSGRQLVIAVTGGGSQAIADLLAVPGASASVLEAVVPYSLSALEDWLGGSVDQACSERTARAMAMAAFERARKLSNAEPRTLVGISATASLASVRPKQGPHRIHVAWQSAAATVAYSVELRKGRRSRAEEEEIASRLVLQATTEACGIDAETPARPSPEEPISRREKRAAAAWTELLLNERQFIGDTKPVAPRLVFPGAFNPLHAGHRRMAELAAARVGQPVTLELSIINVEKPPLDFVEIDGRLEQLTGLPILLTRAPTFVEKAAILPGSTFIVGADTLARIADPAYYAGSTERRDASVAEIAAQGCRLLVFGRNVGNRFITLADLDVPATLRALCDEVPASDFRDDTSSTIVRGLGADLP